MNIFEMTKLYPDGSTGDYYCLCSVCKQEFIGHKRDFICHRHDNVLEPEHTLLDQGGENTNDLP